MGTRRSCEAGAEKLPEFKQDVNYVRCCYMEHDQQRAAFSFPGSWLLSTAGFGRREVGVCHREASAENTKHGKAPQF